MPRPIRRVLWLVMVFGLHWPSSSHATALKNNTVLKMTTSQALQATPEQKAEFITLWEESESSIQPEGLSLAALGGSGLPSEAVLVQGLVRFITKRAQAEAVLHAQGRLVKKIEASKYRCLLPNFRSSLTSLANEAPQLGLPSVAKAFAADVADLDRTLTASTCIAEIFPDSLATHADWFRVGLTLYSGIRKSVTPTAVLSEFADPANLPRGSEKAREWLAALGVLARELKKHPGILAGSQSTPEDLDALITAVLLYLQSPPYSSSLLLEIEANRDRLIAATRYLMDIEKLIREAPADVRTDPQRASALMVAVLGHVNAVVLHVLGPPTSLQVRYIQLIENALAIHQAIVAKEWTSAAERVLSTVRLLAAEAKSDAAFVRGVLFGAALASSKTSDDVVAVLESSTLPAGSYRAKRVDGDDRAPGTVGFNAYLGAGYGNEVPLSRPFFGGEAGDTWGLFAPIGIEFSMCHKKGQSLSLLLSVLDVGNLAQAFYSKSSSLETADDVRFRDIFTPGVFMTYGLGATTPFSVGLGYQSASRLRVDEVTQNRRNTKRLTTFLALDIPLIRL